MSCWKQRQNTKDSHIAIQNNQKMQFLKNIKYKDQQKILGKISDS